MKNLIKQILRENFGYRSGDLGKKAEHKSNFSMGNRHTGHFGTGYYFFGDKNKADSYDDRPTTTINLDKYNLAKGTLELHEMLKDVNNAAMGAFKNENNLPNTIKNILKKFNRLEPDYEYTIQPPRNNREFEALTPEELSILDKEDYKQDKISQRNNERIKSIIEMIHASKDEAPSTIVMKAMGFEGVDVRGTELDNSVYGSVVYDIK